MPSSHTLLIVPPNDPEAVLIYQLAKALEIPVIVSQQPHGASLDREEDVVGLVKEVSGNRFQSARLNDFSRSGGVTGEKLRVIVVEMPGVKTEARLRRLGVELVIIDHHHYTDLDRARDAKGRLLPSSLEQFLKLVRLTDARLKTLGFDPKLVRGVGIMDRGYVWALKEAGYKKVEILRVLAYQKELMRSQRSQRAQRDEERKDAVARKAWEGRKAWKEFLVIESASATELRSRVSLIVALEIGKPTPLIIVEKKRGLIYVQESDHAPALMKQFGGFTFGMNRCWGHKNEEGQKRVGLREVQLFLQ